MNKYKKSHNDNDNNSNNYYTNKTSDHNEDKQRYELANLPNGFE
jgi:hypothetical protein